MKTLKSRLEANKSLYAKIARSTDIKRPLKDRLKTVQAVNAVHLARFL